MTIEEMFRRIVLAHLSLIMVCALLPLAVAIGINLEKAPEWRAARRIQVTSTAPKSSIEADGLSGRVLALATTPGLLQSALRDAEVNRDVRDFAAQHVSADRLGQSSIVQISVTDSDAAAAGRIATALATQVADFINKGGTSRFETALADLNEQIEKATAARQKLTARLGRTVDITDRANVQAEIAFADEALNKLSDQRSALVVADATRDEAVVVGTITDVSEVPSELIPQSALGLLLGLAIGLTAAAVVETVRPRVAGPRALARLLEAPVLGQSNQPVGTLQNAMELAARRQGVETIVLMGVDKRDDETLQRLLTKLTEDESTASPNQALEVTGSGASNGSKNSHAVSQPTTHDASPPDAPLELQEAAVLLADNALEPDEAATLPAAANLRFTDLSAIRLEDEMTAGIVVVSSGTVLHHQLDNLDDVLKTVRWPVLGVLDASRKGASGGPR